MATYKKVEAQPSFSPEQEQQFEISTPQPARKEMVTISQLDRDISGLESRIIDFTEQKQALEAKKVELLKL